MSSHGHERRQGERRPPSDFKRYRDFCPAGISDDTLHGIIRKHKDKADKDDLIVAEINALFDSDQQEETWQCKQKKKKDTPQPSSDRNGGRGRGRDSRGAPPRGNGGGRGNGPVVRRDTPRPKSTELPSSTTVMKPERTLKESRSQSQPNVQKEKAPTTEKVAVPPSGAWGGKGMSLAEKMKSDLQKKEEPLPTPMVAPKPVLAAPRIVEQIIDDSKTPASQSDSAPTSAKTGGGKKSRNRRGKGNNSKVSEESTPKELDQQPTSSTKKEDDNEGECVIMDDLFITGKSITISKQEEATENVNTVVASVEPTVDRTDVNNTPQRKGKNENIAAVHQSPKAVILGNYEVGDEDANFSFGNFGDESPDRRQLQHQETKNAAVVTETPPELSMDSFMKKPEESSGGITVTPTTTTESFGSMGGLTSAGSSGPPGFGTTSTSVAPSNTAPIQQPTSSKSGRKGKGNKDHGQQSHQQHNQDPFGHSVPPGMQTQQSQQSRHNQQGFQNSVSPFGVSSQMYGLDPGAGLVQPPLMGGGYETVYGGTTTKNTNEIGSGSGSSSSAATSSNQNTSSNSANSNTSTKSPSAPSSSPNIGFQGQHSQGQQNPGQQTQGQAQGQPQQGYPSSNQPNMGQMGGYFHPPYGNHPYYGHHYFYGAQPSPPNFYSGRGGQNMFPRVPYGTPDGFGGGGQTMGYDMYNHNQGGMNGQFDSAALNYNQQMQHMHPNQQQLAHQQSGNEGNAPTTSGMENTGSRQKNNKSNSGNSSNNQSGSQGNLLHESVPQNNFGGAGGSGGSGGTGYNQFQGGRQDQQQQQFAGNMYHQSNFPHMMPPFPQPVGNSPVPGSGGLGGGAGGGGNYSQMGGGNNFPNRGAGGSTGGSNYPGGNSRSGGVNHPQNLPPNMPNPPGGNSGNSSSSSAPSNW